ncbi:MAG TPA: cysteine dioxygenase family protein [Luteimonas sp.]|nr:cysteine dioxygenase family protein [Luteimonas sp.]
MKTAIDPVRSRLAFPLLEDVVVVTDAAMQHREPKRIVPKLVQLLENAIPRAGALPADCLVAGGDTYSRREVYRSPRWGYQILLLTWAPGHASTIHDHASAWGVEAVLRGRLEVSDYGIANRDGPLVELRPREQHELIDGRVIGLLPPHDLHMCRNVQSRETAVSLHIYGTPLLDVCRYVPAGPGAATDGWYRKERVTLAAC